MAADERTWRKARTAYERGMPGREVAAKFGLPYGTLCKRVKRDEWSVSRDDVGSKTEAKRKQKLVDLEAEESVRVTRAHLDDLEAARLAARSLLVTVADVQSLKDWANAYKAIQSCQRLSLGMDAKKDEQPPVAEQPPVVVVPPDSADWRALVDGDG